MGQTFSFSTSRNSALKFIRRNVLLKCTLIVMNFLLSLSLFPMKIASPVGHSTRFSTSLLQLRYEGNFTWKVSKHCTALCIFVNSYCTPVLRVMNFLPAIKFLLSVPNFLCRHGSLSMLHSQLEWVHLNKYM